MKTNVNFVHITTVLLYLNIVSVIGQEKLKFIDLPTDSIISIPEDTKINTKIFTLKATGGTGKLTFSVLPKGSVKLQFVDDYSVDVLLNLELVYNTIVNLVCYVEDTIHNRAEFTYFIVPTDVNDNSPVFSEYDATMEIKEDYFPSEELLFTLKAADSGDGREFGTPSIVFELKDAHLYDAVFRNETEIKQDEAIYRLYVKEEFDFEKTVMYRLTVTAFDNKKKPVYKQVSATVVINVIDVDDNGPVFTKIPSFTKLNENTPPGEIVFEITAVDGDRNVQDPIKYSITKGNEENAFRIDANAGKVFVEKDLDRENMKDAEIVLEITAEEVNNNHKSESVNCTILIEDVNDNPPEFETVNYIGNITENSFGNTAINLDGYYNIKVLDKDQSKNAMFKVSVTTRSDLFHLVPTSGISEAYFSLRLTDSAQLDYEVLKASNPLIVTMEAVDVNNNTLKSRATVEVTILDENDLSPKFQRENYAASVNEDSSIGAVVLTVSATDEDSGIYGTAGIRYLIDGDVPFAVDQLNGIISVAATLDRERTSDYAFAVIARDNDGTGKSSRVSAFVKIDDANDNAPKFTQTVYKVAVQENEKEFQTPFYIKAEDADVEDNGLVSYAIKEIKANGVKLDFDYFGLTPGQEDDVQLIISDGSKMDYEVLCKGVPKRCSLEVVIEAADKGTQPRKTDQIVQVLLIDTNDEIPTFTREILHVVLPENARSATPVETVSATDADVTENFRKITYQFTGGRTEAFHLNSTSGAITVGARANLDLGPETTNSLLLSVVANDGIYREDNKICEINVKIEDVNNKPPYFTENAYAAKILENASVADKLSLQLSAKDYDSDHELRYSFGDIKAYSPDGREVAYVDKLFDIDANSGSIFVDSVLDRETVDKLIVTLIVTDTKTEIGERTATAPLTITIEDVNDNEPEFGKDKYEGSVVENSPEGTEIRPVVTTKDKDLHQTLAKLSLAGDQKHFRISSDGLIKVASLDIDREENPFFNLVVIATDDGQPPLSSSVVYHVQVIDVNDNVPEFDSVTYEKSISEGAESGTLVLRVTATDKDAVPVYYAFDEAEDLGYFKINETTGEIFVSSKLDRDAGTTSLKFRVLARDGQTKSVNTQTGTATVIVTLLDENDNAPVVTPIHRFIEVGEYLESLPHNVVEIHGTDPDEGENGRIIFSLADNNTEQVKNIFGIEPLGGDEKAAVLFVKESLLDKVQVFEVWVTAKDKGSIVRTSAKMEVVKVRVLDYNNHSPIIHYPKVGTKIGAKENLSVGEVVFQINATDNDFAEMNKKLVYEIKPPFKDIFKPDAAGSVTLHENFHRDKTRFYKLDLLVCDSGKPTPKCTSGEANVVVQSIHDKEPYFSQSKQTLEFYEETKPGEESQTIIEAIDDDNNMANVPQNFTIDEVSMDICYYIIGDGAKAFQLGLKDGKLKTLISLDHEKNNKYVLYIQTTNDCKNAPLTNIDTENLDKHYLTLEINVLDVNDNPPEFTQKVFGGGIIDNSATSDHVLQLEAIDADAGDNARVGFYIDSDISVVEGENIDAGEDKNNWFSVNEETGVLKSNYQFGETVKGYIEFRVKVNNTKALEKSNSVSTHDTALVKIYILRNDQKSIFVFRKSVVEFRKDKDAFITKLSNLTGQTAYINAISSYIDTKTSMTRPEWCTVSVHYVDEDNKVVGPDKIEQLLEDDYMTLSQLSNEFGVQEIERKSAVTKSDLGPVETSIYAVCGALILLLTAFLSLYCNRVSKLKLQLKASNLSTYSQANRKQTLAPEMPTTNLHAKAASNPLYDIDDATFKESQDTLSLASEGSLVNNETDFEGGANNRGFAGTLENYFRNEPATIDTNHKPSAGFSLPTYDESVML